MPWYSAVAPRQPRKIGFGGCSPLLISGWHGTFHPPLLYVTTYVRSPGVPESRSPGVPEYPVLCCMYIYLGHVSALRPVCMYAESVVTEYACTDVVCVHASVNTALVHTVLVHTTPVATTRYGSAAPMYVCAEQLRSPDTYGVLWCVVVSDSQRLMYWTVLYVHAYIVGVRPFVSCHLRRLMGHPTYGWSEG